MKVRLITVALLCFSLGKVEAQTKSNISQINNQVNKMTATEVVTAYSIALSKGDIPTAFSHFSPDAKWHQPGKHQYAGTKEGLQAIGKMLGDMMGATQGSLAINPTGPLMENGNMVSFPLNFSGKIGDRTVDMNGVDLFRVENGKIVEVWLFSADQAAEDVFWGN